MKINKLQIFSILLSLLAIVIFVSVPPITRRLSVYIPILPENGLFYNEPIPVSGTGSMFPTFPKGDGKTPLELSKEIVGMPEMSPYPNGIVFFGKRYFGYEIGRGDIVVFENEKTRSISKETYGTPTGFVKRVVALPGDTIEIRDGSVILNGTYISEPYIARARSTFGGEFLPDCQKFIIPPGKLFVMGDNRKGSGDSRHDLGLVSLNDVDHVLPLVKQTGILDQHFRDTSNDLNAESKMKIDPQEYLSLLNEKRKVAGLKPLLYQEKLAQSAGKRGKIILDANDFSFEATRSGYTMKRAMNDVSYSNIVWGESPIRGYYEAQELIDNLFEFEDMKKFMLNRDFQEFGLGEVEGEINGCPTQVVVQQFAGYVPPNYKKDTIDSWKNALNRLQSVQPGWSNLKTYGEFYDQHKSDIDRINDIISIRIGHIEKIAARMEANQWLSTEENGYIDQEDSLYKEQESLANKINGN